MVVLCFVVDVSMLSSAALKAVKNCLLQFGNLCALQSPRRTSDIDPVNDISLCYVAYSERSAEYELTVVLRPSGSFDLRHFHHAVRTMPSSVAERVKPEAFEFSKQVSSLSKLLKGEDGLLSWTSDDVLKKVVVISSRFLESVTAFRQSLLEAADNFVTVEFVELEPSEHPNEKVVKFKPDQVGESDFEVTNEFAKQVSEFENCTVHRVPFGWFTFYPEDVHKLQVLPRPEKRTVSDPWSLMRLLKLWHQDIVFASDGPLEVVLLFPVALSAVTNKLFCTFQPAVLQLADVFTTCKICTCHGRPIAASLRARPKSKEAQSEAICGVTGQKLGTQALTDNGIIVGSRTVLSMPSFKTPALPANGSFGQGNPTAFDVIKCVPLDTLSEGLLFGVPHIVSPSSEVDNDIDAEVDDIQVNEQIFSAILQDLHARDCGLLCTSTRNIESGEDTAFLCFYILLPSQNGSFLVKRLAGAEEAMVQPESATPLDDVEVSDQIKISVSSGLSKLHTEEYNPLKNFRGCHLKLTGLVKESLHPPRLDQTEKTAAKPQIVDAGWTQRRREEEPFIFDHGFDSGGRSQERPQPPPNFILSTNPSASRASTASPPTRTTPRTGKRASNSVLQNANSSRKFNAPWTQKGRGKRHQGLCYPPLPKLSLTNGLDPYSFSAEPGPSTELPLLPSKRFPNFKTARQVLLDTTTKSSSYS